MSLGVFIKPSYGVILCHPLSTLQLFLIHIYFKGRHFVGLPVNKAYFFKLGLILFFPQRIIYGINKSIRYVSALFFVGNYMMAEFIGYIDYPCFPGYGI